MMRLSKSHSLRLGNFILYDGTVDTIDALEHKVCHTKQFSSLEYTEIEPIPLTEDWYAKLPSLDPDYRIEFMGEDKKPFIQVFIGLQDPKGKQYFVWRTMTEVPYVHLWQNLHYYLTNGQELELKENEKSNQG